jgi:hypothetical protein
MEAGTLRSWCGDGGASLHDVLVPQSTAAGWGRLGSRAQCAGWGDVVMAVGCFDVWGATQGVCGLLCNGRQDTSRGGAVGAGVCNEVRQREQGATAVCSSGLSAVFAWGVREESLRDCWRCSAGRA